MRRSVAALMLVVALLRHLNTDPRAAAALSYSRGDGDGGGGGGGAIDGSTFDEEHSTVDPVQEHIKHIMNFRLQTAPKAPTRAEIITIIDENSGGGGKETIARKTDGSKVLNYIELFRILARWQLSNVKNCYDMEEQGSGGCSDASDEEHF